MISQTRICRVLVLVALLATCTTSLRAQNVAIKAKRMVAATGIPVFDGVMLVRDGKIVALGKDIAIPDGFRVVDFGDKTIVPGLIDLASKAGSPNDLEEDADAIDLKSQAKDVLRANHRDFALMRAAGVTTTVLCPSDNNIVSGVTTVLKTNGQTATGALAPLALSLTKAVTKPERVPASYLGAFSLLKNKLGSEEATGFLAELKAGKRKALFRADSTLSTRGALSLFRTFKLKGAVLSSHEAISASLKAGGVKNATIAMEALELDSSSRTRKLPRMLSKRECRVAFYANVPERSPEALRMSAVIAARNGLPRSQAIASITSVAALCVGIDSQVGDLRVGLDADFVVLDGDLLDLSAKVHETWISGKQVYVAEATKK